MTGKAVGLESRYMKKYFSTHWPVNMNYAFIVKIQWEENDFKYRVRVMVFNPTFNNNIYLCVKVLNEINHIVRKYKEY
jgi:hypothetical protein